MTKQEKVLYLELFKGMAHYICQTDEFYQWQVESRTSWDHPIEDRQRNDFEMAEKFLLDRNYMRISTARAGIKKRDPS